MPHNRGSQRQLTTLLSIVRHVVVHEFVICDVELEIVRGVCGDVVRIKVRFHLVPMFSVLVVVVMIIMVIMMIVIIMVMMVMIMVLMSCQDQEKKFWTL